MFETDLLPVDKLARRVTLGGIRYVPHKTIENAHSPTPLAIRPANFREKSNPNFVDLTGRKVGTMKVLGISADHKKTWVVRCVCGKYETRSSKAIMNINNTGDCCQWCRQLKYLQREDAYRNERNRER